jgi:hypothetical protein
MQLEYPPEDQSQSAYIDPTIVTKCEPLPDDVLLMSPSGAPGYYTPNVLSVAASASSTIAPYVYDISMYASDMSNTQESDSSSSEPNMHDSIDNFTTSTAFTVAQPGVHAEAYADVDGYHLPFNSYDYLEF